LEYTSHKQMRTNLDLHIHSRYSAATSKRMDLPTIAREGARKGIKIVATGDCLHPRWISEVRRLHERDGLFFLDDTGFVLTTEVEDANRVHHLILVPDLSKATELREALSSRSANLETDGRPALRMSPPEIADVVLEAGCMIGPAHAFTPWTGMYAHHSSLGDCYGDLAGKVLYVELGLSADSDYADRIPELREKTFLTNSDAHSPWSDKLGREFNQMELKDLSFEELKKAIGRECGRGPTLNVGFYPDEGKYNRTACTRCYRQYSPEAMNDRAGRCECGGRIKLGPDHRPPYLHIMPLAEIIAMAIGHKSAHTAGVQKVWNKLIEGKNEIEVLVEADLSELKAEVRVIEAIQAFRSGEVVVKPGGGGRYGTISLPDHIRSKNEKSRSQRSLIDF